MIILTPEPVLRDTRRTAELPAAARIVPKWVDPHDERLTHTARTLVDLLPPAVLTDRDARELASAVRLRRYAAQEVIYHCADLGADVYLVRDGLVKLLMVHESGRDAIVGLHGRGQFVGELALFERGEREATAVAVVSTTALQIPCAALLTIIGRVPSLREHMLQLAATRIRYLSGLLESRLFLDVPSRLARCLLELDESCRPPLSQDELASAIGSTRMTVNKILADLERRGMVSVDRRRVRVIDSARLRREIRP